jgi:tRNA (guanine37-N1)-methyltransferase
MKIDVLTLFSTALNAYLDENIARRARERNCVSVSVHDIREYTHHRHRTVDDAPYGGGPGMILKPEPIFEALDHNNLWSGYRIYLTPQGVPLTHALAGTLAQKDHLVILCGYYEGVDQRVVDEMDLEVSIGDYVLSNGTVAAMVLIDSVVRLVPGVLGNRESAEYDSFADGLLEYPQYTRPETFRGKTVPPVLLSGNHELIRQWRREQQLVRTRQRRPDMLSSGSPDDDTGDI